MLNFELKLLVDSNSDIRKEDLDIIVDMLKSEERKFLLYCDEIKIDNDPNDPNPRFIEIKKRILGLGAPEIEVVIGSYVNK